MDVTRTNFEEVLSELDEILENATFLGIDGEFTGIKSGPDVGVYDTPAQYYAKMRAGSMDFLLVQFGLSVFTYDKNTHKYSQRSYNFYVFPRPLNRAAPDCRFMCQASCISFLASQGFDFNKLFTLGIPYLTMTEEEKLVKRLEDKQKSRDDVPELIPISDDDRPQIEDICSRIDEYITSDAEELTIEKCNAFIRRLVHQEVRMRWPNKLRVESKSDCAGHSLIVQRAGSKEEEQQKEAERREREKLEIKQAVGLSILLRKIADSGKLIVGHNMLLDLCHIVHQFFGALPESYQEFKSLLHSLFPRLLDTKIICQSQQFKENVPSSNLNVLLETISKPPFNMPEVVPIEGRSYSTLTEKSHEAGYDAYITGICFIALANYLGSLQKPQVPVVLPDSPLLNPFLNKLLIARLKDIPHISLVGNDPNPSRDHVFHITFPKEWKHSDISQVFSPFGSVYISWLSDTSAYVGLNRREQAISVAKSLTNKTSVYRVQKYAEYQASLEANAAFEKRKRKLSSSENVTVKKEESPTPTNGVKTTQNDESWELATGNDPKLSSDSITPSSYPRERSRTTSRTHGSNHGVVKLLFEQIKAAQKVRLQSTETLPTDFRNKVDNKKKVIPKYTILRRSTETDLNNTAETMNVFKSPWVSHSNTKGIGTAEGCDSCLPDHVHGATGKQDSTKPVESERTNIKRANACSGKSVEPNTCASRKDKQLRFLRDESFSSEGRNKTRKASTVNRKGRTRSQKHGKNKSMEVGIEKQVEGGSVDEIWEDEESRSVAEEISEKGNASAVNCASEVDRFQSELHSESIEQCDSLSLFMKWTKIVAVILLCYAVVGSTH